MKSYIDIFNLEGKVAVITGGATGLGFSMAQCHKAAEYPEMEVYKETQSGFHEFRQ